MISNARQNIAIVEASVRFWMTASLRIGLDGTGMICSGAIEELICLKSLVKVLGGEGVGWRNHPLATKCFAGS
jgi:hypothetical protein